MTSDPVLTSYKLTATQSDAGFGIQATKPMIAASDKDVRLNDILNDMEGTRTRITSATHTGDVEGRVAC